MLQDGGADQQEIMLQKAKYQGQLGEYAAFSRKMGLKEESENYILYVYCTVYYEFRLFI